MQVSIAYTDTCLPDYFSGDSRPWVQIPVSPTGYTSKELRQAIISEFAQGAVGGSDPITSDFIADEKTQIAADLFYSKKLADCLNREIKFRGKKLKNDKRTDPDCECYFHIVFNIEYEGN